MIAAVLALAAALHDEKVSFSVVDVHPRKVVWSVEIPTAGLLQVGAISVEPLDLTVDDVQSFKNAVAAYVLTVAGLEVDGKPSAAQVGVIEAVEDMHLATGRKYIDRVKLTLVFPVEREPGSIALRLEFFHTVTSIHRAFVRASWGGKSRDFSRLGRGKLEIARNDVDPTVRGTFKVFWLWGAEHIFIGFDHIAFLLALLLWARTLGEIVKIATAFTAGHSVTLALSALQLVHLPTKVTESLIAASIVYVAVENLVLKNPNLRWVLTLVFGLVHGLGFAEVLREQLEKVDALALPLVAFNLGVEAGQLAILLVAFPFLARLRKGADPDRRQRRLVWIGSIPIGLFGLGWLVERVFEVGFMPL